MRSYHHQGVARVGDGLSVTARAAGDGTTEAVEDARRRFMLGVLWHPEEDEADRLVTAFVAPAARRPLKRRRPRSLGASGGTWIDCRDQPVKRGATAPCAQRRNVSGSLRALVPLASTKRTRATTLWRPKPNLPGFTLIE